MTLPELGMILCFGTAAFLFGGIARSADTPDAETAKVLMKTFGKALVTDSANVGHVLPTAAK
ncbi:MAG TPA: hypothetical protein VIQ54_14165 [Polyangia bacterium]